MSARASSGRGSGAGTRAAAAQAVHRVLRQGNTLQDALAATVDTSLPARDQAQISALAFGTLRWHCRHRLIIDTLLDRPLRDKDAVIEALLSVGLFQLLDTRQPGYAAVSATVDAARRLRRPQAVGLVNAALRRFQREQDEILAQVRRSEEGEHAHPQWLIDHTREAWPEQWREILAAAQAHPPMWLRVNRLRRERDDYCRQLAADCDVEAYTLPGFDDALRLARALPVMQLPGFDVGDVSVQDAASQLAADLLAPEPGMRVLDACAAPGGKATHLLERAGGNLQLVTVDVDADRNRMLEDNLRRLGLAAQVHTGDVLDEHCAGVTGLFDRILLDAPCSASGVIRRHPDIRFLRRADDLPRLAERQARMLTRLWSALKPGGRLLYSTCSVFPEENAGVVTPFLAGRTDAAELRPLRGDVLEIARPARDTGYQLLPAHAGTDGFYYALMIRTA